MVVIPARVVTPTLEQCADKGVKGAIVITGGFAETGAEGELLQEEMARVIRRTGLKVVGPPESACRSRLQTTSSCGASLNAHFGEIPTLNSYFLLPSVPPGKPPILPKSMKGTAPPET